MVSMATLLMVPHMIVKNVPAQGLMINLQEHVGWIMMDSRPVTAFQAMKAGVAMFVQTVTMGDRG